MCQCNQTQHRFHQYCMNTVKAAAGCMDIFECRSNPSWESEPTCFDNSGIKKGQLIIGENGMSHSFKSLITDGGGGEGEEERLFVFT